MYNPTYPIGQGPPFKGGEGQDLRVAEPQWLGDCGVASAEAEHLFATDDTQAPRQTVWLVKGLPSSTNKALRESSGSRFGQPR